MSTFFAISLAVMLAIVMARDWCLCCMLCCMERMAWDDNRDFMVRVHGSYERWFDKRRRSYFGIPMPKQIFERFDA